MPSRPAIAVAATGSVGDTMAPRRKATGQDIPSMNVWATTATATHVASTSPIASMPIGRMFWRRSRSDAKNAAEYSSGGRKMSSTRSGSRVTSGSPGMSPIPSPPMTRKIGYGTLMIRAMVTSAATQASSPASTISVCWVASSTTGNSTKPGAPAGGPPAARQGPLTGISEIGL